MTKPTEDEQAMLERFKADWNKEQDNKKQLAIEKKKAKRKAELALLSDEERQELMKEVKRTKND